MKKLLLALAYQIGNEVSYNELSRMIQLDTHTIIKYIDLLEKSFVIFSLSSFSRNLRNEIKKGRKIYFYDLGIRNIIINNLKPIALRNDIGQLWENYLIVERMKYKMYHEIDANSYFWRTTRQQEIDYIEEYNGNLKAFEFKWSKAKKYKISKAFQNAYPKSTFQGIDKENFDDFISLNY